MDFSTFTNTLIFASSYLDKNAQHKEKSLNMKDTIFPLLFNSMS